jgi:hypothetical protein
MQTSGFKLASQCSGVLQAFSDGLSPTGETGLYSQAGFPDSGSLPSSDVRRLSMEYAVSVLR